MSTYMVFQCTYSTTAMAVTISLLLFMGKCVFIANYENLKIWRVSVNVLNNVYLLLRVNQINLLLLRNL